MPLPMLIQLSLTAASGMVFFGCGYYWRGVHEETRRKSEFTRRSLLTLTEAEAEYCPQCRDALAVTSRGDYECKPCDLIFHPSFLPSRLSRL
jgi:hypothetical protein